MTKGSGEDPELRRILALATTPEPPTGAADRLMARLAAVETTAQVVPFRPRATRRPSWFAYAAAVPMAASLALGIYLGAMGKLDRLLPAAITGDLAMSFDPDADLTGVGEAEAYAEEQI
ncbi:MAG: hypothetical protein ACRCVZ_11345 [Aestuariivirga sp.]